jgi:hypothetical protein
MVSTNTRWGKHGIIVAGKNGFGDSIQPLARPMDLVVDDHGTIFVADCVNARIVGWKQSDTENHAVADGQQVGNGLDQLYEPTDMLIDKETTSLIIIDRNDSRVVRWSLDDGKRGELLADNINCWELAKEKQGCFYVTNIEKHEVRLLQ